MRILIQRVDRAAVEVAGERVGEIGRGLLALVGIGREEDETILAPMARKLVNMRLFAPDEGRGHFEKSVLEIGGDLLAVSQFTLYANCRKGRRPSFTDAGEPERAERLFEAFVAHLREYPLRVETGVFGAMMEVSLLNCGPVTIWLDSDQVLPSSKK